MLQSNISRFIVNISRVGISRCEATYPTYSDIFGKSKFIKQKGLKIMDINFMNFADNLKYMASGMLGIFIVIGIIVIITSILNKVFSK